MKALVVVDYQNDFVIGALGFEQAAAIEEAILEKVEEYASRGDLVMFTKDCHDHATYSETQEGRLLPVEHCTSEWGRAIYGRVAVHCTEDNTVEKGGFGSEDLCARLMTYDLESIELAGVVSSICVLSNAVLLKTRFPETPIIIDASCVAAADDSMNEKALDIMAGLQMMVVNRRIRRTIRSIC